MAWSDLLPEPGMVAALDRAGERPGDTPRRPGSKLQDEKRDWSQRLADGCALAIADHLRTHRALRKKTVKPSPGGKAEPLTPLGSGVKKRIDVTVSDTVLGMEIGVSLKGANFMDRGGQYDKNLTGRLYELADEVRVVHEHLPHAFMVGVYFFPLAACNDKVPPGTATSSFANAVIKLRARSGRTDVALGAQSSRCDAAYVALYTLGDEGLDRGVVRFFNVKNNPPRRGRPRSETTLSLAQMADEILKNAFHLEAVAWATPEDAPAQASAEPVDLFDDLDHADDDHEDADDAS